MWLWQHWNNRSRSFFLVLLVSQISYILGNGSLLSIAHCSIPFISVLPGGWLWFINWREVWNIYAYISRVGGMYKLLMWDTCRKGGLQVLVHCTWKWFVHSLHLPTHFYTTSTHRGTSPVYIICVRWGEVMVDDESLHIQNIYVACSTRQRHSVVSCIERAYKRCVGYMNCELSRLFEMAI